MTDRKLMQQALEALVLAQKDAQIAEADYAITALRERLAQPEQEPVAWWLPKHPHPDMVSRVKWSDECEPLYTTPPRCPNCASLEAQNTELDAKLAEMEKGEPVAWRDHVEQRLLTWRQSFVNRSGDQLALDDFMDKESLDDLIDYVCDEYTTPPRREWVGLTEEDLCVCDEDGVLLARYWEAKLKEKNA